MGLGGHLLAERCSGVAPVAPDCCHEAGHLLLARKRSPLSGCWWGPVLVCKPGCGAMAPRNLPFPPACACRSKIYVVGAGLAGRIAAETPIYGAPGGADDRALLGRLWGRRVTAWTPPRNSVPAVRWISMPRSRVFGATG